MTTSLPVTSRGTAPFGGLCASFPWAMLLAALLLAACSVKSSDPDTDTASGTSQAQHRPAEELEERSPAGQSVGPSPATVAVRQSAAVQDASSARSTSASSGVDEVIVTGSSIHNSDQNLFITSPGEVRQRLYHSGPETDRENYLAVASNPVKLVTENPISTFSVDVDTAAYSNLRRMLMREGRLPPRDAVRIEEMINYFNYDYPVPDSPERPLTIATELMQAPWNPHSHLLMVGINGYEPAPVQRPAANLVFLVDVSGSMQSSDKLGLVKRSLKLLVDQMQPEDRIALVVYAGAAGMVLDSTPASAALRIRHAIDSLTAGGSTNGAAGIQLAYRIAERNLIENGINRVIIASDGDLNVGMTDIDALKQFVASKRDNGVALTSLGFGSGNYNYSLMEQIADVGNGNAAYIDSLLEARKVLIEEMQSTLLTIAGDVKIQIEFNPSVVREYRLIGYENRLLNREDFINDKVEAGDIGAGHTVTALYEVSLVGSDSGYLPDSRYGNAGESVDTGNFSDELAYVRMRYKLPRETVSTEVAVAVTLPETTAEPEPASDSIRFAAAVAGFGQLLRGGKYTSDWGYEDLLELARQARGADTQGYRSEMLSMIEIARLL